MYCKMFPTISVVNIHYHTQLQNSFLELSSIRGLSVFILYSNILQSVIFFNSRTETLNKKKLTTSRQWKSPRHSKKTWHVIAWWSLNILTHISLSRSLLGDLSLAGAHLSIKYTHTHTPIRMPWLQGPSLHKRLRIPNLQDVDITVTK